MSVKRSRRDAQTAPGLARVGHLRPSRLRSFALAVIAVWALALAADRLYGADVTETLRTGLFDAYLKTLQAPRAGK